VKKLLQTLTYEIENIALFEDRRFEKALGERFLFVDVKFLIKHFNRVVDNSLFNIKPISLNEEFGNNFYEIFELQPFLTTEEYNILLFELLKNIRSFDQMNILIYPLLRHKNYSKELINYFIEKSLNDATIRRSFEVQKHLLTIIVNNKALIDSSLFHRVLSNFPHKSGDGLGWVEANKL
jgi:hypothetical protein